jgi:4-hydroxy-tetrahydrodipicolinate synthase
VDQLVSGQQHPGGGDGLRHVERYAGVNASLALPMTPAFDPDEDGLRRYARWIAARGASAVTVNADTGEGAHLTPAERIRVVEVVKDEVGDRVRVVSGLIATYTEQAVVTARELKAAGADELLVFGIPAFQGHPLDPELVYGYHAAIGEVGLPLIGFSLTPALGGVVFEPEVLARLADVPALAAFKEASFDPRSYVRSRDALRAAAPDVAFLSGCDTFIPESAVLGAHGCLLGYAGLAPDLTAAVFEHARAGRAAEALALGRERMEPLARALYAEPVRDSRVRIKEGLKLLGLIDCVAMRPPLLGIGERERSRLRDAMAVAGLLPEGAAGVAAR